MKKAIFTLSTAMLFTLAVFGQNSADRDTSFNVSGLGTIVFATGGQFSKVTALDGGKVLVTGSFYSAATTAPTYARILRLNNDGSFDNTFNLGGVGASGIIAATAVQADGKIIIGGNFPAYNGTTFGGIARINADGSIDNTFNPGTGFASIIGQAVRSIAIQSDGKLIIGGGFTSFNGTAIAGVCRLNADGSLDNTFSPGSGPNNIVEAVAIQADGKIIAGGVFGTFNGVSTGKIVRLNSNGSLDNTFTTATSGDILRIVIQPDGKILASGNSFYRLESDGSLDIGFSSVTAGNSYNGLALQQDGKIILSGFFTTYLSTPRQRIVRLNTDGTVDLSFDSQVGFSTNPNHLAIQQDGKILVYGGYQYKGVENLVTRIMGTPQTASVDKISNSISFKLHPNPANNFVVISDIPGNSTISITDMSGKLIYTSLTTTDQTKINTIDFKNGIYLIQVSNNGMVLNKKFLINR